MYYIYDEPFETKEEAWESFVDEFDFTESCALDELCEKMRIDKDELLGRFLLLSLRGERFEDTEKIIEALEEVFANNLREEEDEGDEDGD